MAVFLRYFLASSTGERGLSFLPDSRQVIQAPAPSIPELSGAVCERAQLAGILREVREVFIKPWHNVRVVSAIRDACGLTIDFDCRQAPVRFRGAADARVERKAIGH